MGEAGRLEYMGGEYIQHFSGKTGSPVSRCESNNNKKGLNELHQGCGVESTGPEQDQVTNGYEHNNERSNVTGGEYFQHLAAISISRRTVSWICSLTTFFINSD
jgi:hypothetical protein